MTVCFFSTLLFVVATWVVEKPCSGLSLAGFSKVKGTPLAEIFVFFVIDHPEVCT